MIDRILVVDEPLGGLDAVAIEDVICTLSLLV